MSSRSLRRLAYFFLLITVLLGVATAIAYKNPRVETRYMQSYGPSCPICEDIRPITITVHTNDYSLAKELAVATGVSLVITAALFILQKHRETGAKVRKSD